MSKGGWSSYDDDVNDASGTGFVQESEQFRDGDHGQMGMWEEAGEERR